VVTESRLSPAGLLVTVVSVQWFGSEALELTYKTPAGKVANELLYRDDEPRLEIVEQGRPGASTATAPSSAGLRGPAHPPGPPVRPGAGRAHLGGRSAAAPDHGRLRGHAAAQPLRFLLADDPGAGKTIMAGLLIKELIARGDLQRCLIVCPGSLAEQWQDELYRRFHLPFEILTNDKLEAARTGNWFLETNLVIARLDKLSRNEDVQQKLRRRTAAGTWWSATRPTRCRPRSSAARPSTPSATGSGSCSRRSRATSC
jgi:hypothetical protein